MRLQDLLSFRWLRKDQFSLTPGRRCYAIGDIHGRHDLLTRLVAQIEADHERRGAANRRFIFLGDYIDRGAQSRQVIDFMMTLDGENDCSVFLMGNHEEALLATADGDWRAALLFHRMGGRETLLSYGAGAHEYDDADASAIIDLVRTYIPAHHLQWMRGLQDSYRTGGYLFVHAGIRPGISLGRQKASDMRWIRTEFLEYPASHGMMVVHGHSVSGSIDERPNRIGIDTGAYASGVLTAIGLEGNQRWFLQSNAE